MTMRRPTAADWSERSSTMAGSATLGSNGKRSSVGGSVTAVHNSLTVQPNNNGQGLITVQGIQFPNTPAPPPRPPAKPSARFRMTRQ